MSIYVDRLSATCPNTVWPYLEACHLYSDAGSPAKQRRELRAFAKILKLKQEWLQYDPTGGLIYHFDLTRARRSQALAIGAIEDADDMVLRRIMTATRLSQSNR